MKKVIQGYSIDREIGKGRYSTVHLVHKSNVVRAIKIIELQYQDSVFTSKIGTGGRSSSYYEQICSDVLNEINIISQLSSDDNRYIVQYYEHMIEKIRTEDGSESGCRIFIVMEYLKTLTDLLKEENILCEDVIHIGKDIAQALITCHENCILHRDIKPDNIFISTKAGKNRKYKLGDFGVSRKLKQDEMASTLKGTPNYIAPEVYKGIEEDRAYEYSSDIYSLALVLYVLLNENRLPFYPDYPSEVLPTDENKAFLKRIRGEIPKNPVNAPDELGEVLKKALSDEKTRYQSITQFLTDWNEVEQKLTVEQKQKIASHKLEEISANKKETVPQNHMGEPVLKKKSR